MTHADEVDAIGMGEYSQSRYLDWLEEQIASTKDKSYRELLERMHEKEFVWLVPNDDNRIEDGLDIRNEFFRRRTMSRQRCSVLEVLIGLSRRLAFIAGGEPGYWAWELLINLGLSRMSGHIGKVRAETIDEILETLIWRTYESDGSGGFFPLGWPNKDQRKVELWYQMCAYIDELPES